MNDVLGKSPFRELQEECDAFSTHAGPVLQKRNTSRVSSDRWRVLAKEFLEAGGGQLARGDSVGRIPLADPVTVSYTVPHPGGRTPVPLIEPTDLEAVRKYREDAQHTLRLFECEYAYIFPCVRGYDVLTTHYAMPDNRVDERLCPGCCKLMVLPYM